MTKSESVQKAYKWAFEAQANKHSTMIVLFCAKQIAAAVESHDKAEDAYEAIVGLLREWTSRKRAGMERPIKTLERIMQLAEETQAPADSR